MKSVRTESFKCTLWGSVANRRYLFHNRREADDFLEAPHAAWFAKQDNARLDEVMEMFAELIVNGQDYQMSLMDAFVDVYESHAGTEADRCSIRPAG